MNMDFNHIHLKAFSLFSDLKLNTVPSPLSVFRLRSENMV